MTTDTKKLTEAVNFLVASPKHGQLVREMGDIISNWTTHPMVYGAELTPLNSLIDLGLTNFPAYEKLIQLAGAKRMELPEVKRQTYQRRLMRERRNRTAKAVRLHELTYGPMTAARRKEYAKGVQRRWSKARAEFLDAKGPMTWHQRNDAIGQFWAIIDRQLDINIARKERSTNRKKVLG